MRLTDQLGGSLQNVPTPGGLKAARIAKGLSLAYVSERLALHPTTLREVEEGTLKAMDPILCQWESILTNAPDMRSRRRFNVLAAGIAVALAFVIGCTVYYGGR